MARKAASTTTSVAPAVAAAPKAALKSAAPAPTPAPAAVTSPVRNSPVPKAAPGGATKASKEITYEAIARRAYEIWQSGTGGSQEENWYRAERELRGA